MSTISFSKHHDIDSFDVRDNELVIGDTPVSKLSTRANGGAFYAYDRNVMAKKVALLRAHFPSEVKIHYAIKANPMPAVVEFMSTLVDGLDIASLGEMSIACATATPREEISFAGPGKQPEEIRAAIEQNIVINCESPIELERIDFFARKLDQKPRVALRVNPDFRLQNSGMKMSGGSQQFGIDAEQIPMALHAMQSMYMTFYGFHIFSGSQNLSVGPIIESQIKALELAVRLSKDAPAPVKMLNIGGGLGVPYFPGEKPLDIEPIGENLNTIVADAARLLPEAEIIVELGRYLVAEAGVYICRITDKKISRGHTFLITNGGLHHHLAASGNFGQILRKNYPVAIATNISSETTENASVVGPLCTPLDLLAAKMDLSDARLDDLVAVFQSGAYGYTASPHYFLGHPPPEQFFL